MIREETKDVTAFGNGVFDSFFCETRIGGKKKTGRDTRGI